MPADRAGLSACDGTRVFYYFNGFNSAILKDFSGSPKIVAVDQFARDRDFRFVPVSINFRQAVEHRDSILGKLRDDADEAVFCGSSMGGWFARIMQLSLIQARPGIKSAAIGFNPVFEVGLLDEFLIGPQVNYVTFEEYEWTADHGRQLKFLEKQVDYDAVRPFYVYCDKNDEVIPWKASAARHHQISRFVAFAGGCHSFDHFNEALTDFGQHYLGCEPIP